MVLDRRAGLLILAQSLLPTAALLVECGEPISRLFTDQLLAQLLELRRATARRLQLRSLFTQLAVQLWQDAFL